MRHFKIIAIAKDEAAYLAEWIHHHLFFGFDSIDIYTNRLTDNTEEVLEKICRNHPNVRHESADWIDYGNDSVRSSFQNIAYAYAYEIALRESQATHIMFLDIDEYWLAVNFKNTISDCIDELGDPKSISFQWACEIGSENRFPKIGGSIKFLNSQIPKTIFRSDADIDHLRIHFPKFEKIDGCLLADGKNYVPDNRQDEWVAVESAYFKNYFILHKMYRSEIEYISSLYRGNPNSDLPVKDNRHGFVTDSNSAHIIEFRADRVDLYARSYQAFVEKNQLENSIILGEKFILDRAEKVYKIIPFLLEHHASLAEQVFQNTKVLKSKEGE